MKMTKIESARIIAESTDNPVCRSILCSKCFNSRKGKTCKDGNLVAIEKAKAYIKRHEQKTKKKDHILDTTKKVEEPKPIKTVGIDNSDVTLAQHKPTPLEIAKMIRDNGYSCLNRFNQYNKAEFSCSSCPLGKNYCGHMIDIAPAKDKALRKKLIDDYISQHEPTVKENLSVPQPVKFEDEVPEYVYIVTNNAVLRREVVQFVHKRYKTQKPDMFILTVGGSTMSFEECYRTPEEALQVAKKLWNGDGK